jgi:hypothetical protein
MKKKISILAACFLLIFLSSCLSTLYPIFHENDVVFNQRLLGNWKYIEDKKVKFIEFRKIPNDRKSELTASINKISDKAYLVSRTDSLGIVLSQSFVFLAKIGKNYYLDYYPAEMPSQKGINKFYKSQCVKIHMSYKIDFKDNDHFEMKRFDGAFLDKLIADNKINIRHVAVEGDNIITASTDDLQKFIIQYSENPKAFVNSINCGRVAYY